MPLCLGSRILSFREVKRHVWPFCLRISTIRLFVYLKKRAEEYMCNSWWKRTEKSVGMMPDWKPGYKNGKPVRVLFSLPVKFGLK